MIEQILRREVIAVETFGNNHAAMRRTFTARLLVPGPVVAGSPLTVLRGRWLADRGMVLTAIVIAAAPARQV